MTILPIGHIQTPFTQKFGIPRQAYGLSVAKGSIVFDEHINAIDACEGIMQFSHIWLVFQFHQNIKSGWTSKVRPPRLGGNTKTGVFATRSSFRPNALGMSVVKVLKFSDATLMVEGVDMLNGTPVYDIKPYIGYADSIPNAKSGFASEAPSPSLGLTYENGALASLTNFTRLHPDLPNLIENTLAYDPRPAYKQLKSDSKQYHIRLYDIDITFSIVAQSARVVALDQVKS